MYNKLSEVSYHAGTTLSHRIAIKLGYLMLIGFAIIRPISLIGGRNVGAAGINLLEIFGIGISYCLLLPLITTLRKLQFDRITFLILLFCLYVVESVCWGSNFRQIAQVALPFLLFFSARIFITESYQMKTLLMCLVLAFIIPIALSTYNIVLGRNIFAVEFWNKLVRNSGAFNGPHTLGYIMLFFSFFYCILHYEYQFKNTLSRVVMGFFLILSVYCLYQSHTRTTIVGLVTFWFIYLWGNNRKLFYGAVILSIIAGIIFHYQIYKLVFKKDYIDLDSATSGRIEMVVENSQLFLNSSMIVQLLGRGMGDEQDFAFHNDYIHLLISFGLVGLSLYLILLFYLFWDIFWCEDKTTKYLFGSILISIAIMSLGSNAIVFRVELSQYFWLIMGLFYCIPKGTDGEYETNPKNFIGELHQ